MQPGSNPPLTCRHCAARVVLSALDADAAAIACALQHHDAQRLFAAGVWLCTDCGAKDAVTFDQREPAAWLALARDEYARHAVERALAHDARTRFQARALRLQREIDVQARERAAKSAANASGSAVEAALARARTIKRVPPTP